MSGVFKVTMSLLVCSAALVAQPRIEVVGGLTRRMSDTYRGEKATSLVTVKNTGNDTLRIANVKASCGCTAAVPSANIIAPQDTASIQVVFNSKGYRGSLTK